MSAIPSTALVVEDAALKFLQLNDLDADFYKLCDLARECYPEVIEQHAELREDVDEPGLHYVRIVSTLPNQHPVELGLQQLDQFHRRLNEELPSGIWIRLRHKTRRIEG